MAGRGPIPKDPDKRARRNVDPTDITIDPTARAKARPLPGSGKMLAETRRWWKRASMSPQAEVFLETDWLVMERLACLQDAFFRGQLGVASEIRLIEANLGFTAADRRRLGWKIEAPKGPEAAPKPTASARPDPRLRLVGGASA